MLSYPEINIVRELFHSSSGSSATISGSHFGHDDNRRSVLIPVQETLLKRVARTFFEENLSAALAEVQATDNVVVRTTAKYILLLVNAGNTIKYFWRPHLRDQVAATSMANYTGTRDWARSPIRGISWHPNTFKMAVAASDDSIRVYTDETGIIPVLKYGLQKGICSMAWRPFASGELAVGCQNGIILWTLQAHSHLARPLTQVHQLKSDSHFPVTSVGWNHNGSLLVSASINDPCLILWDVDYGRNTPLKRVGHPCSLIKWSPDGSRLFAATVGNVFRVWSTEQQWTPERWTVGGGATIQSVVWSPCSSHVLFVTSEDHLLYAMKFMEEQLFNSNSVPKQALPVADLRKQGHMPDVGGRPQSLAWDPSGKYLAVSYKDSPAITIFQTTIINYNLNISPSCTLTTASTDLFPSQICFQAHRQGDAQHGAVLTIGWASGRIQYYRL